MLRERILTRRRKRARFLKREPTHAARQFRRPARRRRDARAAWQLATYAPFSKASFCILQTQQNATLAAPASAVFRNGRPTAWSTAPRHPPDSRRARSLPRVTIAPGCVAKKKSRRSVGSRDASHATAKRRGIKTTHSLLSAYARHGSCVAGVVTCVSVFTTPPPPKRTPSRYEKRCAAEVTNTTRAEVLQSTFSFSSSPRNAPSNRRVSNTGARTFTCMWRSWPSIVRLNGAGMSPALCTRRCSGRFSALNASAKAATEAKDSRSTRRHETRHGE